MKVVQLPSFLNQLKQADSPPFLLLNLKEENDSELLTGQIVDLLQQNKKLGIRTLQGQGLASDKLFEELFTGSLFDPVDLVIIFQADKLSASTTKCLLEALQNWPKGLRLLLAAAALRSNSKLLQAFDEKGLVLDLSAEKPADRENRLSQWLQQFFSQMGCQATPELCRAFLKQIGADPVLLKGEAEKLVCYLGDRKTFTVEEIGQICVKSNSETIWQWGEAFLKRDRLSALRIGRAMLADGEPFLGMLKCLRGQFQTSFQVASLPKEEVQQLFPYMKGRILEHHQQMAKGYGFANFVPALLAIDRADYLFRNGTDDPELLLDLLIAKL